MDYGRWLERLMAMDDATWKRHANPLSVWTRFAILPILAFFIWSRLWIGWWSVVPITILIAWTAVNPRAFPKPASTNSWASMATFGERVWLNRQTVPIPVHHVRVSHALSAIAGVGVVPLVYGLFNYDLVATLFGLSLIILGKLWFLDRMVWLYQDMKDSDEEYASWLY